MSLRIRRCNIKSLYLQCCKARPRAITHLSIDPGGGASETKRLIQHSVVCNTTTLLAVLEPGTTWSTTNASGVAWSNDNFVRPCNPGCRGRRPPRSTLFFLVFRRPLLTLDHCRAGGKHATLAVRPLQGRFPVGQCYLGRSAMSCLPIRPQRMLRRQRHVRPCTPELDRCTLSRAILYLDFRPLHDITCDH